VHTVTDCEFFFAGFLFVWFKPPTAGPCSFNVAVITMSIVLFVSFTLVSISPIVRSGTLFPSAVISVYCMYLAYSALQSEPHSEVCNGLGHKIDAASGTTLAIGMVFMLLSVVYSAFKCALLHSPLLVCQHPVSIPAHLHAV
jgi:serine incorporator 1/3